jgi:hypothetical protein
MDSRNKQQGLEKRKVGTWSWLTEKVLAYRTTVRLAISAILKRFSVTIRRLNARTLLYTIHNANTRLIFKSVEKRIE